MQRHLRLALFLWCFAHSTSAESSHGHSNSPHSNPSFLVQSFRFDLSTSPASSGGSWGSSSSTSSSAPTNAPSEDSIDKDEDAPSNNHLTDGTHHVPSIEATAPTDPLALSHAANEDEDDGMQPQYEIEQEEQSPPSYSVSAQAIYLPSPPPPTQQLFKNSMHNHIFLSLLSSSLAHHRLQKQRELLHQQQEQQQEQQQIQCDSMMLDHGWWSVSEWRYPSATPTPALAPHLSPTSLSSASSFWDRYDRYLMDLEEEQDEEEDDDDDDDDGSCSMLSNASLQRSQVEVPSSTSASPARVRMTSTSHASMGQKQRQKVLGNTVRGRNKMLLRTKRNSNIRTPGSSYSSLLSLRGGGAGPTGPKGLGTEVAKRLFVSALVTLVFEACMGHVLEFLKIAMQTSETRETYAQVISRITEEKGMSGLWDGFLPWGVVQSLFKGAVFGMAHTAASSFCSSLADQGRLSRTLAQTLAGGIGGGFQGYILSPTLLLKTRVMTNPIFREKMPLGKMCYLSATVGFDVVRNEGLPTLFKGANVFATKRVFDWATRYYFAELFESYFRSYNNGAAPSLLQKSIASLLGGVFSTCCTLPLDVLVAKLQDAKRAGEGTSAFEVFRKELKEEGLNGLKNSYLRGFEARLLHVCLTVVVVKTMAPVVYNMMFGVLKK